MTPTTSPPTTDAEREGLLGWKLVPIEPAWGLDGMSGAGAEALPAVHGVCGIAGSLACAVYKAMLDAAPQPPSLTTQATHAEAEVANLQEVVRIHSAACIRAGIRASHAEALRDDMEAERDAALAREARLREGIRTIAEGSRGDIRRNAHALIASTSEPQPAAEGER